MSRLMMRPPGPLPWTACRSSPLSDAMRRASGEDRIRPPPLPLGAADGAGGAAGRLGGGAGGAALATFSCGGVDASPWDCIGVAAALAPAGAVAPAPLTNASM